MCSGEDRRSAHRLGTRPSPTIAPQGQGGGERHDGRRRADPEGDGLPEPLDRHHGREGGGRGEHEARRHEAPDEAAVDPRFEQGEGQGAAGDREDAVARPVQEGEGDRSRDAGAAPHARREGHRQERCGREIEVEGREAASEAADYGDDGTNDLIVSSLIRTNEMQVWFLAEHLAATPLLAKDR